MSPRRAVYRVRSGSPSGRKRPSSRRAWTRAGAGIFPTALLMQFRLSDGTLMLDFGNNPLWFMSFGQNFNSLQRSCSTPVWVSIDDTSPGSFTNQQWINSVYREGSVIHGIIHNE